MHSIHLLEDENSGVRLLEPSYGITHPSPLPKLWEGGKRSEKGDSQGEHLRIPFFWILSIRILADMYKNSMVSIDHRIIAHLF
jgi:hypothetical protein